MTGEDPLHANANSSETDIFLVAEVNEYEDESASGRPSEVPEEVRDYSCPGDGWAASASTSAPLH